MTTEELILGHFDKSLTPEQESLLQERLSGSQEARSMFDQHRNLETMLHSDAATLAPSSRLDEAVIVAALTAVPEIVGGGAMAWLGGKMAAVISTVVIGGASIALLMNNADTKDTPAPESKAPAVSATPVPAATTPSVTVTPSVEAPTPAVVEPKSETMPKADAPARTADRSAVASKKSSTTADEQGSKKLRMGIDTDKVTIDHGTQVTPDSIK